MSLPIRAVTRPAAPDGFWLLIVRKDGSRAGNKVGYLKYFQQGMQVFETVVQGRFVRLFRVLADARRQDAQSASGTGGWRTREEIGRLMGLETEWVLPPPSISSYGSTLTRRLEEEWDARVGGDPLPALLEAADGQGWRLRPEVRFEINEVGET
jgi:hypothetical protein